MEWPPLRMDATEMIVNLARKTVVVAGATGLQGRAVTHHLLRDGWHVRALTRNPNGPQADALAQAGAEVIRAQMEDVDSLRAASEGAWGLFSVQPTVGSPRTAPDFTADDEVRWGVNVAEAAHAAGIGHFVFTSVAESDRHLTEKLPVNLVSKWRIERHVAELGLPATILRPVSFMENFTGGYALRNGNLSTGLAPEIPQQIMAVDDVGAVTALAFSRPKEWIGRAVSLAGDELTPVQIAAAIGKALGTPLPYVQIPIDAIRALSEDFAYANEWLNTYGYRADIPATRAIHPDTMDFGTWLERTGASQIAAFLDPARTAGQDA